MTYSYWKKILFLLLIPCTLLGQVPKKELSGLPYDTLKKMFLKNDRNLKLQKEIANAYLIKSKLEQIPIRIAKGYYMYSVLHTGNKSICFLDSVIKYSRKTNDIDFPAVAYTEKAYELKSQFKYNQAIDNFILAEKYALKNNIDYYFEIKYSIAVLRSEELGETIEALNLYRECLKYYRNKEVRTSKYSIMYQNTLFALADAFKTLNQSDSATYYNKLGYKESKITKNEIYNSLFILNEGANLILKKKYKAVLDSIKKALPKILEYKDEGNTLAAYYYLGKAYEGLGNKPLAMINFIKVDSLYNKTKRITPEFTSGYSFLISYFKYKGDKSNQLKYLTKYMYIDSTLQKNYKELTKKLQKEYDTPHLLSEKENLIQSLENDKTKSYWGIGGLFFAIISVTGFGVYQNSLKKKYKSSFEKIIKQTEQYNSNTASISKDEIDIETNNSKEDIGIAEELIKQILEKLKRFESKKEYLQANITVQTLSNTFETNSKYISKIVNTHKGKTFIQYINDLRIEYALIQLQKDNKLRKYTIHALSLEYGFNNAESFSTAFYKKTGLKPTYFIKELENSPKP
jgi:AraC-like DNA-binding protein